MKAMKRFALVMILTVMGSGVGQWMQTNRVAFADMGPSVWFVPHTIVIAAPPDFRSVTVVNEAAPKREIPAQWEWAERGKTIRLTWVEQGIDIDQPSSYRPVVHFSTEAGKAKPDGGVTLSRLADRIEVKIDGQPFTGYYFKTSSPKPFLHPLRAASGKVVTRGFPVERGIPGEPLDHPHHRAWWFSHGDVNGTDFWGEETEAVGRIEHRSFDEIVSGPVYGRLVARSEWVTAKGERILNDRREITFYRLPDARMIDFVIELQPTGGPVKFGDTKEGSFAIRVAAELQAEKGTGRLENALGQQGEKATWGKRADWVDYSGTVGGERLGITIFDHPSSFRHPSFGMVRDYGLFATNPFGERAYSGNPKADGTYVLNPGKTLTIRHRVLIHTGDTASARLPQHYRAYIDQSQIIMK